MGYVINQHKFYTAWKIYCHCHEMFSLQRSLIILASFFQGSTTRAASLHLFTSGSEKHRQASNINSEGFVQQGVVSPFQAQ